MMAFAITLIPHGANQAGVMNFAVARNQRQAGESGLSDDHAIVRISDGRERCGFEKQGCIVNSQIKIISLCERYHEVAKR